MANKRSALIIVDPQGDFGNVTGALYVPKGEQVVPEINALRAALLAQGVNDVFITQDHHPSDHVSFVTNNPGATVFEDIVLDDGTTQTMWPPHCVRDSAGAAFLDGLVVLKTDVIVEKGTNKNVDSYSGFGSPDELQETTILLQTLKARNITHVVVVGLAFDYCVCYTARDAAKHGFHTCVVRSATRGISVKKSDEEELLMKAVGVVIVENNNEALKFAC